MAPKMAALQTLLVLLWVCVAVVTACPSGCTCGPYKNRHSETDLYVDCSGRGLETIPANLPKNTKSLNMANNRLTTVHSSNYSEVTLEELDLSGNNIQEVPWHGILIKGRCTFWDLDGRMNYQQRVISGEWHVHDFKDVAWPCAVDLRNNPISRIKENAFSGSHNFTILLGQSSSDLTIESGAFQNTANVIGLHISSVPTLTISHHAFHWMNAVYWMIIDRTEMAMQELAFGSVGADRTSVRWFRISNSNILGLRDEALAITMDVQTNCDVTAYPYPEGSGVTLGYMSYIYKGGIEIINNTLPVLPEYLLGRSNFGGIYFKDNKIASFQAGVFARKPGYEYAGICLIRFADNEFPSIPSGAFRALRNVTYLSIYGGNFSSIEANAFADSSDIGSLSIHVSGDQENEQVVIKSKAFAKINGVKEFYIGGVDHEEEKGKARVLLEPQAFNSLNNVEYMIVGLHDNMDQLPSDLFTGLTVNQRLELRARDLTKIDPTAFGRKHTGTSIKRLHVSGIQNIPCDCETANLNINVKDTVEDVRNLQCKIRLDDGFVYQTEELDATCSACSLSFSLVLIIGMSVFLNL